MSDFFSYVTAFFNRDRLAASLLPPLSEHHIPLFFSFFLFYDRMNKYKELEWGKKSKRITPGLCSPMHFASYLVKLILHHNALVRSRVFIAVVKKKKKGRRIHLVKRSRIVLIQTRRYSVLIPPVLTRKLQLDLHIKGAIRRFSAARF